MGREHLDQEEARYLLSTSEWPRSWFVIVVLCRERHKTCYYSWVTQCSNLLKKDCSSKKVGGWKWKVQKLLESFGCKHPVTSDSESQPSHFKVKTRPEDGTLHRCSVCTFESGDVKKVKRHRDSHRVSHCLKCDGFFLQKNLTRHKMKCETVKIHKCDFDEQKCDFSSPREYE